MQSAMQTRYDSSLTSCFLPARSTLNPVNGCSFVQSASKPTRVENHAKRQQPEITHSPSLTGCLTEKAKKGQSAPFKKRKNFIFGTKGRRNPNILNSIQASTEKSSINTLK